MNQCRCQHALGLHGGEDGPCVVCGCPEFRLLETLDSLVLNGTMGLTLEV